MNNRVAFLSTVAAVSLMLGATDAAAAGARSRPGSSAARARLAQSLAGPSRRQPGRDARQLVEHAGARGGADGGRDLMSWLSVELTEARARPRTTTAARGPRWRSPGGRHGERHRPACADGRGRAFPQVWQRRSRHPSFRPHGAGLPLSGAVRPDVAGRRGTELRARALVLRHAAADRLHTAGDSPPSASTSAPTRRNPRGRRHPAHAVGRRLAVLTPPVPRAPANPGLNRERHAPRLWLLCWRCP